MRIKNFTLHHHCPRITSRRPPQPEFGMIIRAVFAITDNGLEHVEHPIDQGFVSGDTWDPEDVDRLGDLLRPGDLNEFKTRGEFFARATCHTPDGKPTLQCPVRISVGDLEKLLVIQGDRNWTEQVIGASLSEPAPFTQMPIRWDRAFGGPNNAANPVGCGQADTQVPNIEAPDRIIKSSWDVPAPAGFSPISPEWAPRKGKRGRNYGSTWRQTRWPFVSDDFDWTHWQQAPPDQWLPDGSYFRGDESVQLQNLWPNAPVKKFTLPGIKPRAFIQHETRGFMEVPLQLDTVNLELDESRVALVWRGLVEVDRRDFLDVPWILIDQDRLGEERDISVFEEKMQAFIADPLAIDESVEQHIPEEHREAFREAQAQAEEIRKAITTPTAGEPTGNPISDLLQEKLGSALPDVQAKVKDSLAKILEMMPPDAPPLTDLLQAGVDKAVAAQAAAPSIGMPAMVPPGQMPPIDLSGVMTALNQAKGVLQSVGHDGPAIGKIDEAMANPKLAQLDGKFAAPPPPPPDFSHIPTPPEVGEHLEEAPPPPPDPADQPDPLAQASEAGMTGRDLSHADLSNRDLREEDFSDCNLTGANFTGSNCAGVSFIGALCRHTVMNRTDLTDAVLAGANFEMANLSNSVLDGANAADASFDRSSLHESSFEKTDFSGASFHNTVMMKGRFVGTSFAGAEGDFILFHNSTFENVDFSGATITAADFHECTAVGINMQGAEMTNMRAMGADFKGTRFVAATLDDASFKDADLTGSDFRWASLTGAFFQGATATACRFQHANLNGSCLRNAILDASDFTGANLCAAEVIAASCTATTFTGANLYHTVLEDTDTDQAIMSGTVLEHVLGTPEFGKGAL